MVVREAIILHKIIKSQSLFSCDAAETYCFPDIFKGAGLIDETGTKETGSSFQRVYTDAAHGSAGRAVKWKFQKGGIFGKPIDYQKNDE